MKNLIYTLSGIMLSFGTLAHDDQEPEAIEYSLADLLILASGSDQEPLGREELREESDVIVHGVIKSITPGRELYTKDDVPVPIPLKTAIFEVSVNYAEKGFEGDTLLFEYIMPGIPAKILNAVKPDEQTELFLRQSWIDEEDYRIVDAEGRTKGFDRHLYYPTRDIALIDQLPRDRRYDISALLRESGEATDIGRVDGGVRERVDPDPEGDADGWDVFGVGEEVYLPEKVRESLRGALVEQ